MASDADSWMPGQPVSLTTRRSIVRTLAVEDISPALERWNSDPAIAGNVWHPPLPPAAYFRGLIAASDQKTRFSFLIQHRGSLRAVGYVKLFIDVARRVQVPTVALGERAFWNGELGTEAVRAVQRFAFEHLPVDAIESRVYAENVKVRERLRRFGYEEVAVTQEQRPGGGTRAVHVFQITREAWFERLPAVEEYLAQKPDPFEEG